MSFNIFIGLVVIYKYNCLAYNDIFDFGSVASSSKQSFEMGKINFGDKVFVNICYILCTRKQLLLTNKTSAVAVVIV